MSGGEGLRAGRRLGGVGGPAAGGASGTGVGKEVARARSSSLCNVALSTCFVCMPLADLACLPSPRLLTVLLQQPVIIISSKLIMHGTPPGL